MKIWVTKYALTEGILDYDTGRGDVIEICTDADPTGHMVSVHRQRNTPTYQQYFHGKGKDWHTDLDSAIKRAEAMRTKRIISLQRQIEKLTTLAIPIKYS